MRIIKTVRVTQRHIDKGKRWSVSGCPVALALTDALPNGIIPEVSVNVIVFGHRDFSRPIGRIFTPYHVSEFIEAFDDEELVLPFEFTLNLYMEGKYDLDN